MRSVYIQLTNNCKLAFQNLEKKKKKSQIDSYIYSDFCLTARSVCIWKKIIVCLKGFLPLGLGLAF